MTNTHVPNPQNDEQKRDTDRVGLSQEGRILLDEVMADGHFKDNMSCYRFAVSIALRENVDIENHVVVRPQGHMYLISQIDPDGIIGKVIGEINPKLKASKYRALEKYADLGMHILSNGLQKTGKLIFWVE
jgi:hypothetical protein